MLVFLNQPNDSSGESVGGFIVGTVFDCKKHSNIKRHASYRCIGGGRYYKGIAKYKSEKHRRQQILRLQNQGYSLKQIASLLGVSRRTIHRDCQKLRPYTQAEFNRLRWGNSDLANLSLKDQVECIKRYREVIRKVRLRGQVKALFVRVDVEAVFSGRLGVVFSPRLPVDVSSYGKIVFELAVQGKVLEVARLYAIVPSKDRLLLTTNLSNDPTANPPLGLEVVDPEHPEHTVDSAQVRQLAQIQRRMFRSQNPWRMQEFLGLAPEQQDRLLAQYSELCGTPNHLRKAKTLTVTLNVDQALNAAYAATYKPHLPVALGNRSKIILKLQASTKIQHLTTLHATDIDYGLANMERAGKPLKKLKGNALKGLRIIDKADPAIKGF